MMTPWETRSTTSIKKETLKLSKEVALRAANLFDLDKRRTKAIERKRLREKTLTEKAIKAAEKKAYHCLSDATKALETLTHKNKDSHWHIVGTVEQNPIHAPGRTPQTGRANGPRKRAAQTGRANGPRKRAAQDRRQQVSPPPPTRGKHPAP